MIHLTRLNNSALILNPDLIEHLQATPDTIVTLTNGRNYLVRETTDEIIKRIIAYRREILTLPIVVAGPSEFEYESGSESEGFRGNQ